MPRQRKGHYNIVFLGLDGAGKTRSILRLGNDSSEPPKAAWGFNCSTIPIPITKRLFSASATSSLAEHKSLMSCCIPLYSCLTLQYAEKKYLTCYDVGGHEKIRKIWPNYYADVYASVFIVDGDDPSRWPEAKSLLFEMASHPMMKGKPLLIILNHKRLDGLSPDPALLDKVKEALDVEGLVRACLKSGASGTYASARDALVLVRACVLDDACLGLRSGIEWLIKAIEVNYITLTSRVALDIEQQEKKWEQEKAAKKQQRESGKVYPAADPIANSADSADTK